MTDPQLPPQEEARLRRLLADARHTAPMPDDVVGRLDEVLARLAEEEPVVPPRSEPDPVVVALDASRRRTTRRRVAGGLLAAAALVVGGVTIPQLLDGTLNATSDSADSAAEGSASDPDGKAPGGEQQEAPEAASQPSPVATFPPLDQLRAQDDVTSYLADSDQRSVRSLDSALAAAETYSLPCRAAWGTGHPFPIVFGTGSDQVDGVAVVRAASPSGERRADLYVCGRVEPVGSVRLPTP